ncbi:hypothetical protein Cgig2_024700 [Carnegiea gigantea]|uniref:peptidylprolyl isomerase n=1 Tax=Carnegiea gigantea TaxID=171969 RepID=A0A9Q1GW33_9CARY|nr:hypothetical protein Cgig2_024700 [Carnegiea gigantea]
MWCSWHAGQSGRSVMAAAEYLVEAGQGVVVESQRTHRRDLGCGAPVVDHVAAVGVVSRVLWLRRRRRTSQVRSSMLAESRMATPWLPARITYKPPSCEIKANTGDRIKLHYRGQLTDGTVFGSTYETADPVEFELGSEDVIQGWNQGLVGMCVGEKRKLKVPSKLGYGKHGFVPSVPGGASLIFETELVSVNGKRATQAKHLDEDSEYDEL